jgi:hypothetical protein
MHKTLIISFLIIGVVGFNLKASNYDLSIHDSLKIIEKVYLHTDRNNYNPGEIIWFKAYLIDASSGELTDNSKNLHIELISPESKIVGRQVVRLNNGLGHSDLSLPQYLVSGKYILRAYTNYMRNYGDILFFNKNISIINPNDTAKIKTAEVENRVQLYFFPEGGSLVDNVSSVVSFKTVDASGKGCNISGDIFSSDGNMITTLVSTHLGMGSFVLRPVSGMGYSAVIKTETGESYKFELPKSFERGISIHTSRDGSDNIDLTVKTNSQTLSLLKDTDLILLIKKRNDLLQSIKFRINSLFSSFLIPLKDLQPGIIQLTLSVGDSLPICERLLFIAEKNNGRLNIESDKKMYLRSDTVLINVDFISDLGYDPKAFLSFSAFRKGAQLQANNESTITSWFLLESDIRGKVEDPAYYFDKTNKQRFSDFDLLLCTQGWRDFRWKYDSIKYLPEDGFTLTGRLKRLFSKQSAGEQKVRMGLLGNENWLYKDTLTAINGQFTMKNIELSGESIAWFRVQEGNKKTRFEIQLDSNRYEPPEVEKNPNLLTIWRKADTENNIEFYIQNKNMYKLTDTINIPEVKVTAKRTFEKDPQKDRIIRDRLIYGMPDNEIIITPQNESYSNALEVLSGRIPGVTVIGTDMGTNVVIRGAGSINKGTPPLFLIDGVKASLDEILLLPVFCIDRIDVIKGPSMAMFGMQGGAGVIAIITRTGSRIQENNLLPTVATRKFTGYNNARIFFTPGYDQKASPREPDIRRTFLWEPDIILNSGNERAFKFKTAGYPATIEIKVEGITDTGIPLSGTYIYENQ